MPSDVLSGCRVLIAEDEYMLADDLRTELTDAGAVVLGPVGRLSEVLELIDAEPAIDGAILDVNLGGEKVYPAADKLVEREVPMMFATGYDASAIPSRYSEIARCEKPLNITTITSAIGKLMSGRPHQQL